MNLFDILTRPYEVLLAMLRTNIDTEIRTRIQSELRSRDRAAYNQWVEVCGGQFK